MTTSRAERSGTGTTTLKQQSILVLDPIDETALRRLGENFDVRVRLQPPEAELRELVRDVDVLIVRSGVRIDAAVVAAATRLSLVCRAGSGTDNLDLVALAAAGVRVFNVPGGSSAAVAELALGLTFAVARKIALADRQLREGIWDKPRLAGRELGGSVLGVVGYGAIGTRVAALGRALSMRVLVTSRRDDDEHRRQVTASGAEPVDLKALLTSSDVVCLAVPLTDTTRGMVGAGELALMKDSSFLINVARAGVVDEDALLAALRDRTIAGAGLDVMSNERTRSPFADLDNVVLTPHIGAMSLDAQRRIGEIVVDSIHAALSGGDIANVVC